MMGVMKKIGVAALGLAILIGGVGKVAPHWLLSLPFPISVILWSWTGHKMPPFIIPDAWKEDEIDTWMKDGDVVVATGIKSGTTFMLYCTHQIRTKGTDTDDHLFPDVSLSTPWPDLRQSRAGSWSEQKDRYNTTILSNGRRLKDIWDHPSYPFRVFKSHYGPPELPVRKKGGKKIKYIAMVRNGIDVAASYTKYFSAQTTKFRSLWGGYPPMNTEDSFDSDTPPTAARYLLPGGYLSEFYFGYVKKWWSYRDDPNVLLLHYSDVRQDLRGHVAKIARFLNVELNEEELDKVTERCSIEHMRKLDRFDYLMPLNTDKGLWDVDKDTILKSRTLVNEGLIGRGSSIFSGKVVAQWKKAEEDEFGHDPAMLKWARGGGEYPPVE